MARRRLHLRRPPWWLLVGTVVGVVAIVVLLTRSSEPSVPLRAADVPAAVKALETKLGGPQRYTEINATTAGVNLFVAADGGNEVAWYYERGRLDGPAPAQAADATRTPFGVDGVALTRSAAVARAALGQFPGATLIQFALLKKAEQGVVFSLSMQSSKGGRIDVTFTSTGNLIGGELK